MVAADAEASSSEPPREEEEARELTLKERTWLFVEDNPFVGAFILIVIVFSIVTFVLESEFNSPSLNLMWFGCAADRPHTRHAPPHAALIAPVALCSCCAGWRLLLS